MYSFPNLKPVRCSMSSSNCCFLICIQISQEAGQVVWYSHLFKNFPVCCDAEPYNSWINHVGRWKCVCLCECETLLDHFASITIVLATQKILPSNPVHWEYSYSAIVFNRKWSTRKPGIWSATGIGPIGTCATTCPQMKSMHSWHHKGRGETTGADAHVNII